MLWPLKLVVSQIVALGLALPLAAQAPPKKSPDPAKAEKKTAKLRVKVPEDDAELFIMGKPTQQEGLTREFDLPELEPGKEFEYEFLAKWRPNNYTVITRKKTVTFKVGQDLEVDLSKDDPADRAEIRFVPTPEDVVDRMVKMAKITEDDVVFEPGCGDGRIVTAAVKAGAKRGVGIDLDPDRVAESKETVKAAMLEGKVEIRQGDALDIKDFSDATVVFLYMGDEFNALIRPILWKSLKPGTRIVSHRFTMGDWKPDQTVTMMGADGDEYELHVWTVTEEVKKRAGESPKVGESAPDKPSPISARLDGEEEDEARKKLAEYKKKAEKRKKDEEKRRADAKKKAEKQKAEAKKKADDKKIKDDKRKKEEEQRRPPMPVAVQ